MQEVEGVQPHHRRAGGAPGEDILKIACITQYVLYGTLEILVLLANVGLPTFVQLLSPARKCLAYVLNMSNICPCLGFD